MRFALTIASIAAAVVLLACAQKAPQREAPRGEVLAVHVTAAGAITVNGRNASLDEVKREITRLAAANGTLRYSRENPQADPHPNAMEVIKAAADAKLPIEMLEKP